MKYLILLALGLMSFNSMAVNLRCDHIDGLSAGYAYTEMWCKGGGHSYDVTLEGIAVSIRSMDGKAKINIKCPGQTNPEGRYFGFRLGLGAIVGGEIAAFANPMEGFCGVGGASETTGLTVLEASVLTIRRR
ncbi:MAG: hypothetical protein CME62_14475 [Halobacteriovoraceae bacterium]|nr:hypothetical protein [Halobacteriovoraceae bacterium]|tara:strand:- start:9893 stop:10288 length:396 start_codon:yes stop_codon:yes gene_type:complete